MDSSIIFHLTKLQYTESDLLPLTRVVWENLVKNHIVAGSYAETASWFHSRGLTIDNVFFTPNGMFKYWYIDGYAIIGLLSLSSESMLDMVMISERVSSIKERAEDAIQTGDFLSLFIQTEHQFYIYLFYKLYPNVPKNKLYDLFVYVYSAIDYGFQYFTKEVLLDVHEHKPNSEILPPEYNGTEIIKVYRGQSSKSTPIDQAYSWSLVESVAKYFSTRWSESGIVYNGYISRSDIIAYIDRRKEFEVLVLPEKVFDIKILTKS